MEKAVVKSGFQTLSKMAAVIFFQLLLIFALEECRPGIIRSSLFFQEKSEIFILIGNVPIFKGWLSIFLAGSNMPSAGYQYMVLASRPNPGGRQGEQDRMTGVFSSRAYHQPCTAPGSSRP